MVAVQPQVLHATTHLIDGIGFSLNVVARFLPRHPRRVLIYIGKRVTIWRKVMDVKVGDRVMYGKYSGTDIELNGQQVTMTTEADLMGIIRDVEDEFNYTNVGEDHGIVSSV